jgi:hypothetical protein
MAVTPNSLITPQTPKTGGCNFQSADGSNFKTLFTAGPAGAKVIGCIMGGFESTLLPVRIGVMKTVGGFHYSFGTTYYFPSAAYNTGRPSIDLMAPSVMPWLPVDSDGQRYILLEPNDMLSAAVPSGGVTGAIQVFTWGMDFATGVANSIITPQKPRAGSASVASTDALTPKTFFTAGPNGSKVMAVSVSQNDGVVHDVQLFANPSGYQQPISVGTLGIVAGWDLPADRMPCDAFSKNSIPGLSVDANGQRYLLLGPNEVLQFRPLVAMAAGTSMLCIGYGEDF